MRIDNIEVVGLPEPDDDNTDKSNVLQVINSLNHNYGDGFTSNDVMSFLLSERNGERVVVCKLRSRKYKHVILDAKKQKRNVKLRGNDIFINEHLGPNNRRLFSTAPQRKCELEYKFLWTKNENIYLKKNESYSVHIVTCNEDLVALS